VGYHSTAGTEPTTLPQVEGIHLPAEVLRAAGGVQRQFAPQLMADPAFFGVGVTQSYDNPAEAALLVLVDLTKTPESMPDQAGGLRLRTVMWHQKRRMTPVRSISAPRGSACVEENSLLLTGCAQCVLLIELLAYFYLETSKSTSKSAPLR